MLLNMKHRRALQAVLWAIVLAIMALIYWFSSQTGEESSGLSLEIARFIMGVVRPNYHTLPAERQAELLDTFHLIVRKGAHFSEYAGLAFFLCLLLHTYQLRWRWAFSWLGATLYAVTDEVHQLFVSARAGSAVDVLVDSAGALCGTFVATILLLVLRRIKWLHEKRRSER